MRLLDLWVYNFCGRHKHIDSDLWNIGAYNNININIYRYELWLYINHIIHLSLKAHYIKHKKKNHILEKEREIEREIVCLNTLWDMPS